MGLLGLFISFVLAAFGAMFFTRNKVPVMGVAAGIGILILPTGCIALVSGLKPGKNPTGIAPIHTLLIQFDEDYHDNFISRLEGFSSEKSLEFSKSIYSNTQDRKAYMVVMRSDTFDVVVIKLIDDPIVKVHLLPLDKEYPPPMKTVDIIFMDFKKVVNSIPGLKIISEK